MKTLSYSAITAVLVTRERNELLKLECAPNGSATAGLFVQVHDFSPTGAISAPAEGAVPVKWWPMDECRYKEFKSGALPLVNGLYVCLSSTGPTKTLATGGSDKLDYLHLELGFAPPSDLSYKQTAGGVTSAVWAQGSGPRKLHRVRVQNLEAGVRYLQLFGKATPVNGDRPLFTKALAANGSSGDSDLWDFGHPGRDVRQVISGTEHLACTLALSTTAETLTAAVGAGADMYSEHRA